MKIYIMLFFSAYPFFTLADLQVGFYSSTCPQAESIVRQAVQDRFSNDQSITAALLRMHYHDCFVRGCDASILIDSREDSPSEKGADANFSIRGYDLIDQVKERLEFECPSTVSCADIITLATRDAVALGGGPNYEVPTGRLDGLVSSKQEVNLPGPSVPVSVASQIFSQKGFTLTEMVTLLGAHTVGAAGCKFFTERISGSQPDPTMDPALRAKLADFCGSGDGTAAFLDQGTSFMVDNQFYSEILMNRGILQIDQQLALDESTRSTVSDLALNGERFQQSFAEAMIKLGMLQDAVGANGEIRRNCRVFNTPK